MTPKPYNCHPGTLVWAQLRLRIACYRFFVTLRDTVSMMDMAVLAWLVVLVVYLGWRYGS